MTKRSQKKKKKQTVEEEVQEQDERVIIATDDEKPKKGSKKSKKEKVKKGEEAEGNEEEKMKAEDEDESVKESQEEPEEEEEEEESKKKKKQSKKSIYSVSVSIVIQNKRKTDLVSFLESKDINKLLSALEQPISVLETTDLVQSLSGKQHESLWNLLKEVVLEILAENVFSSLDQNQEDEDGNNNSSSNNDVDTSSVVRSADKKRAEQDFTVLCLTILLCDAYSQSGSNLSIKDFQDTLISLHDILSILGINTRGEKAQEQLCSICERIFLDVQKQKKDSKENGTTTTATTRKSSRLLTDASEMIAADMDSGNSWTHSLLPQTFCFLLAASLEPNAKQSDVKRVFNIREALSLFDFSEDSIVGGIKELLMRAVISPLYLKTSEGKRFINYLLILQPKSCELAHAAVISQIPSCRASILDAYGEIYFKAWKIASGQCLLKLENACIQDLMWKAIHARTTSLFSNIRVILEAFHSQKKHKGVDEMLLRLYEPILFRSLSVANALVRKNAATLFIDAFPLRDPDQNVADTDDLLQKQFTHLNSLLKDSNINVRCVAVEGACKILATYWEMLEKDAIYSLLTIVINHMAFDASSNAVRVSAIKGLSFLLDNHLSHPVLKGLLPKLAPLVNDSSESVRLAIFDLLLRIKAIRSIRYFEVVSLDSILMRLAIDGWWVPKSSSKTTPNKASKGTAIGEKITSLLINSYFPFTKPSADILERYLDLVKRNPDAARNFFRNIAYFKLAPLAAVCKLISILSKFVVDCINISKNSSASSTTEPDSKKKKKKSAADKKRKHNAQSKDDEDQDNEMLIEASKDVILLENTVQIMANLLEASSDDLKDEANKELNEIISDAFSRNTFDKLQSMVGETPRPVVSSSIYSIAKYLPKDDLADIINSSEEKITKIFLTDKIPPDYRFILECLCVWGRAKVFLNMVIKHVKTAIEASGDKKSAEVKKKYKKGTMALFLLSESLTQSICRESILADEETVENLDSMLRDQALDQLCKLLSEFNDYEPLEDFLLSSFNTTAKLILHKFASQVSTRTGAESLKKRLNDEMPLPALTFIESFSEKIIPSMFKAMEEGSDEEKKEKDAGESDLKSTQESKKKQEEEEEEEEEEEQNQEEEEIKNKKRGKSKRKADGEEAEKDAVEDSFIRTSIFSKIVESMCAWIAEFITLGILREASGKRSDQTIEKFFNSLFQDEMGELVDAVIPHISKIIYQMIDSGWNVPGIPCDHFVEMLVFYANNIFPSLQAKEVKSSRDSILHYSSELIKLCSKAWLEEGLSDISKILLSRAIREIATPETTEESKLWESKRDLPNFPKLCMDLVMIESDSTTQTAFEKAFFKELLDLFLIPEIGEVFQYKAFNLLSVLLLDYKFDATPFSVQVNSAMQNLVFSRKTDDYLNLPDLVEDFLQKLMNEHISIVKEGGDSQIHGEEDEDDAN